MALHFLDQPGTTVSGVTEVFGINRRTLAHYRDLARQANHR
ncbi:MULTISPECIES: hypothetical protein [Nocardia]|nr:MULTISPECIES: hypothetical protein [Nocardia]